MASTARQLTSVCCHRGNRIVYELALQELFIAYSGYGGEHRIVAAPTLLLQPGIDSVYLTSDCKKVICDGMCHSEKPSAATHARLCVVLQALVRITFWIATTVRQCQQPRHLMIVFAWREPPTFASRHDDSVY